VSDLFVSTEGLVGRSQPGEPVLTFASDMCVAELVDEHNQPVRPGVASRKLLVTNLHNRTQPLIRYELTDQFRETLAQSEGVPASHVNPYAGSSLPLHLAVIAFTSLPTLPLRARCRFRPRSGIKC